ncbi:MAG: hypothetical protein ABIN18_25670 [Pseudomonadota bacterium]
MKNTVFVVLLLVLGFPVYSSSEEFLGAPVIPEGKVIKKTDSRLEMKTGQSHDEILQYYREALKEGKDIKFREWKDATYIEDNGNLAWHSITISKGGKGETTVVIMKDNWTWIIGTLILRYIGVFAVLLVLFLGMTISGKIIASSVKKAEARKAAG